MITLATFAAILLYLIPIALFCGLRLERQSAASEVAIEVPTAVATDLLVVLLLARVMRLETAAFVSRILWIIGGASYFVVRRRRTLGWRPQWPAALGLNEISSSLAAGLLGILVSLQLSRPFSIWDRRWHTPLVATIRAQRIPFSNVYDPHGIVHYHHSGDALGALVQALSFDVLHASLALSVVHDILFGLLGLTLALLFRSFGWRRPLALAAGALVVLLSGPLTLWRPGEGKVHGGYSYSNFLTMSFRPHVVLAGLLFVGFAGAMTARLRADPEHEPRFRRTAFALLATTALLAVTDEASAGLLGLALGAAWLAHPGVVHPKRWVGMGVFAGLLAAFIVPNLAFAASLSPGAPHHDLALVGWRSPGYHNPPLSLMTSEGRTMLLFDLAPILAVWIAGVLLLARRFTRARAGSLVFFSVLAVVSILALVRIELNQTPLECHRFVTAVSFLAPVFGLFWLAPDGAITAVDTLRGVGTPAALLVSGAIVATAVSTMGWLHNVAPKTAHRHTRYFTNDDLYAVDCRAEGARFGQRPRPEYIAKAIWYRYAGCVPVFAPGKSVGRQWAVKIGAPQFERAALLELHRTMLTDADVLRAECPLGKTKDPICAYATSHELCRRLSAHIQRCELTAEHRRELLGEAPPPALPVDSEESDE
jgi:hypothetical protein